MGPDPNQVQELRFGKKEYDPFKETWTTILSLPFLWTLKGQSGRTSYIGNVGRRISSGDEKFDYCVLRINAEAEPVGRQSAAIDLGKSIMVSEVMALADSEKITLKNEDLQTPNVDSYMGNLYKCMWEGSFHFESEEQIRSLAYAENLEIRVATAAGNFDLEDEPEERFQTYIKLFYNHAYDESAFADELDDLVAKFSQQSIDSLKESQGCFIATAAYGSASHPDLDVLRSFRDGVLNKSRAGTAFVRSYYRWGPRMANHISDKKFLKLLFRVPIRVLVSALKVIPGLRSQR